MADESNEKRTRALRSAVLDARPEYERLGRWIKKIRESKGLQQKPLSRALGKPEQFLNKVEHGRQRLDVVELIDLLKLLDLDESVPIGELMRSVER